jgi:hypothetical protein
MCKQILWNKLDYPQTASIIYDHTITRTTACTSFSPAIGVKLPDKTTSSTKLPASRATAQVCRHGCRTADAFETTPIVVVCWRVCDLVVDGQQWIAFEDGTNQIIVPFCCEVYPVLSTDFFQSLQAWHSVCSSWDICHTTGVHHLTAFDANGNHKLLQMISKAYCVWQKGLKWTNLGKIAHPGLWNK